MPKKNSSVVVPLRSLPAVEAGKLRWFVAVSFANSMSGSYGVAESLERALAFIPRGERKNYLIHYVDQPELESPPEVRASGIFAYGETKVAAGVRKGSPLSDYEIGQMNA